MDVDSGGSKWDLYLELSERPSGILGRAQYDPDLFDAATVRLAIEDLRVLLQRITVDPSQWLSNIKYALSSEVIALAPTGDQARW
jgi:surfactin family lipopeptide synthetase A